MLALPSRVCSWSSHLANDVTYIFNHTKTVRYEFLDATSVDQHPHWRIPDRLATAAPNLITRCVSSVLIVSTVGSLPQELRDTYRCLVTVYVVFSQDKDLVVRCTSQSVEQPLFDLPKGCASTG